MPDNHRNSSTINLAKDSIDSVLEWRESGRLGCCDEAESCDVCPVAINWPEHDYDEIAQAVLNAIGYAALLDVAEAAEEVAKEWTRPGRFGPWSAANDRLVDALGKIPQQYPTTEGES